jgi:hypothetical protein
MDTENPRLTPDQKRIMLVLCDAAESHRSVRLVTQSNAGAQPIRETTTAAALERKGLARKVAGKFRYEATTEGFWLGDTLRIEDRQGRIPARRIA